MFSKINSFSTRGIDGYRITVEVDVSNGLPSFVMVGYLAEEVREAQERVRTALRNAGFCLPPKRKWMGWKMRITILHRIGTNGRLSVNWVWTAASSR